jgi:hypothetical protein
MRATCQDRNSTQEDRAPKAGNPYREDATLAVDVPERAAEEEERRQGEEARVRDLLLASEAAAQFALDRREGDVDDRPVDSGDARAEDRR